MPSFYPENNTPQLSDDQRRSLHKINALLNTGSGTAGTPSAAVTSVQGIAAGVPVGVKPTSFRATATFTRPGDTNAYAQFDAITNSTSAPAVMTLAIAGAASGDFVDIRNVRLNTSTKPSGTKLSANVFFAPATFTATNDNAELSIDDTTAATGVWCPCANQYQTALNYRAASDPVSMLMQLSAASIFATLQANTAWAPGNADVVTLVVEGFLYKA
jgi:hypothetical protein